MEHKKITIENILPEFMVFVYVLGILTVLSDYIVVQPYAWLIQIGLLALVAAGSFCLRMFWKRGERWFVLLPGGAVVILVLLKGRRLWYGMAGIINAWICQWNISHEDGINRIGNIEPDAQNVGAAALLLSLLLLTGLTVLTKKRRLLSGILLAVISLIAELLSGNVRFISVSLLLTGLLGMYLFSNDRGRWLLKIAWLSVYAAASLLFCSFGGEDLTFTKNVREAVADTVENTRYGSSSLPEGDLYRAHQMAVSEKAVLRITTEQVKTMYFRGFTGACYEKGVWTELKNSAYGYENQGMFTWLEKQGFSPLSEYAAYEELSGSTDPENHVTVENVDADREYVYLPYGVHEVTDTACHGERDNGYRAASFLGAGTYDFTEYSGNVPGELLVAEKWIKDPENEEQKKYLEAEKVYRSFVYKNYCTVSDEVKAQILSYFYDPSKADDRTGIYSVTSYIRKVLKNMASYKEAPQAVPDGADPVCWFLTEGQEGNSALFASTAVEAYRSFGIPARYAEGYILTDQEVLKASGETVTLTEKDSHAWVQIYLDGAGWIDVDVTPGFYYEEYALMQMVQKPQGIQMTADLKESAGKNRSSGGTSDSAESDQNAQKEQNIHPGQLLLGAVLAAAILIVSIIFVLELRRYGKRAVWNRRLRRTEPLKQAELYNDLIFHQFELLGICTVAGYEAAETEDRVRRLVPAVQEGEYVSVNRLLEKAFYGGKKLESWEMRSLAHFADKLLYHIGPKSAGIRYIRIRYRQWDI